MNVAVTRTYPRELFGPNRTTARTYFVKDPTS